MSEPNQPDDKKPLPPVEDEWEEHEDVGYTPNQAKHHFTEEFPSTTPLAEGASIDDVVAILRESYSTVTEIMTRQETLMKALTAREDKLLRELREKGRARPTAEEGNPWVRTLGEASETAQVNGHGEATLSRDGSEWVQVIDHEGSKIRPGSRKQRMTPGGSADDVLAYLSKKSGVGTTNDVPLPHSGLWVRLKSPSLADLTSLQFQILQMKVSIGSATKGQAYSNLSQTATSLAVDFALRFVIDANVHFQSPSDLKEHLNVLDFPILLWGLAYTIYPQGFPYAHPCVADIETCQHITRETINVNRLYRVDHNALTKVQKKHLATGFVKQGPEAFKTYREEHVYGANRKVWFDDIGLELRLPNMQQYEEAGKAWIDNIISLTQGAFNEPPNGANRRDFITSLAYSTSARQYSHWVTGVYEHDEEGGEQLLSEDQEVIDALLENVFSSNEFIERFLKAVHTFMDDSLIAMIAIPSFNCEKCHTPIAKKFKERFDHLVPIDVLSTFFILVDRKLS